MTDLSSPSGAVFSPAKPLAIDLFCGKGGWTNGLLATGWRVIGFDIVRWPEYPGQLVLQDVATLDGRQFRGRASLIVASPPCQAYSYRAMPFKRAKALPPPSNDLFEACFRIAREAECPLIVENVKGAQPWVGRARWHFGSYYLWGDVPALMPSSNIHKFNPDGTNHGATSWFHGNTKHELRAGVKNGGDWFGSGPNCSLQRRFSGTSDARRNASAEIAKIPFDLARWIGECFYPQTVARQIGGQE